MKTKYMKVLCVMIAWVLFGMSLFSGEALPQSSDEGEETEIRIPKPSRVQEEPAQSDTTQVRVQQDPTVVRKLDEVLKGLQDIKDDLAKVKDELAIIKVRATLKH
jgi:hypothetical protein